MTLPFSLICAEKFDQAQKLAAPFPNKKLQDHIFIEPCSIFPKGAIVICAAGHLLELYNADEYNPEWKSWKIDTLPIVPEKFKLKPIEQKKRYLNAFKKYLKDPKVELIIHCGDAEVEGQVIIDEILYEMNNKKPVKRLWTSSLTKTSVVKAFNTLKDNQQYRGYYNSGIARQRGDWLVGISSSRALTVLLNQKGINNKVFSAGRVQTALMGIIYQREIDIESFISRPYWDCYAEFQFGEEKLSGKWFTEGSEHIFNQESANSLSAFCKESSCQVYSVKKEEKSTKPPQFYHLSTLQTDANRLYGMSPAEVLANAQTLYDKSLITYPRTDSEYITEEEAKWLPTILNHLRQHSEYTGLIEDATRDISTDKRYVDPSKVSDHYALIPTEEKANLNELKESEKLIYDMIAKSVIAAHYSDYKFDVTEVLIAVQDRFSFKCRGTVVREKGWKVVFKGNVDELEEGVENQLPNINEGTAGTVLAVELKEGATQPPARFTQGDLIKVMSNAGRYVRNNKGDFKNAELSLGTPATRANIVSTVTTRYVEIKKNKIYLLPEGRMLIEALGQESYLSSVLTTGRMERFLTDIQKGHHTVEEFIRKTTQVTHMIVEQLKKDSLKWEFSTHVQLIQEADKLGDCFYCGASVIDAGPVYGCSKHKETGCDFKIYKTMMGKTINKTNVKKLLVTKSSGLIKGFTDKKNGQPFDGFVKWDELAKRTRIVSVKGG